MSAAKSRGRGAESVVFDEPLPALGWLSPEDLVSVPRVLPTFDELLTGPSTTSGSIAHRARRPHPISGRTVGMLAVAFVIALVWAVVGP